MSIENLDTKIDRGRRLAHPEPQRMPTETPDSAPLPFVNLVRRNQTPAVPDEMIETKISSPHAHKSPVGRIVTGIASALSYLTRKKRNNANTEGRFGQGVGSILQAAQALTPAAEREQQKRYILELTNTLQELMTSHAPLQKAQEALHAFYALHPGTDSVYYDTRPLVLETWNVPAPQPQDATSPTWGYRIQMLRSGGIRASIILWSAAQANPAPKQTDQRQQAA